MNFSPDPDETRLRLRYIGDAVSAGRMNAEDFTIALNGLRETLVLCSDLTNGGAVRSRLSVSADIRTGSFDFAVIFSQLAAVAGSLPVKDVQDALEIAKVIFGENGLVALMKFTKGEPPSRVSYEPEGNGNVIVNANLRGSITVNNNITITPETWKVYGEDKLRPGLYGVMKPLIRDGMDALETTTEDGEKTLTTANEAAYFVPQREPIDFGDGFDTFVEELVIVKQSFERSRRWYSNRHLAPLARWLSMPSS